MTDPSAKEGVVKETIGALRATPVLLVMVLLNLVFVTVAAVYLGHQQDGVTKLVAQMLDRCLPVHQ